MLVDDLNSDSSNFCIFEPMRHWLFLLILGSSFFSSSQKPVELKKRYYGSYEGQVNTFKLDTGDDLVDVEKTNMRIFFDDKVVIFDVGRYHLEGTYTVLFEAQKYYVLDCTIPGRLAGERIVIYKRGKQISRDGLFPQPSAMLDKIR
jgi:hypothetical protein